MRPIDADLLKTDLTRFYDNEITAKRLIDEQPTIPAIPVKWLEESRHDSMDAQWHYAVAIVLSKWQKEQEGR